MVYIFGLMAFILASMVAHADSLSLDPSKRAEAFRALRVPPNATPDEIQAAHRKLMKTYYEAANQGDPNALDIVGRANAARDLLTNKPSVSELDAPTSSRAARPGSNSDGGAGAARSDDRWRTFRSDMANALSDQAEQDRLRQGMIPHVRTADDFTTVARNFNSSSAAAVEFATRNMAVFMRTHPALADLNLLAMTSPTAEGQRAIYRAALAAAETPGQVLRLIKPPFGKIPLGGRNWQADLNAALKQELPRLLKMAETPENIRNLGAALRALDRHDGERLFLEALKASRGASAPRPPVTPAQPGLFEGLAKKFARRFMAVDPSLATGVAAALVTRAEANALNSVSCPGSFAQFGGRILTAEYKRLLALSGRDAQELTALDCARTAPELGSRMMALVDQMKAEAAAELRGSGHRVRCENAAAGGRIELLATNGLRATLSFTEPDRFAAVEVRPQEKVSRPNDFLRFDVRAGADDQITYCALGPKQPTARDQLPIIRESEDSLFTRLACAGSGACDHLGFISNVTHADSNVFSFPTRGEPDEHAPFGDLDRAFIQNTAGLFTKLMTVVRGRPDFERTFANVCRDLGGEPPAGSTPARAHVSEATPTPTSAR